MVPLFKLLLQLVFLGTISSYKVEVQPNLDECFYTSLDQGDLLLLSYDVVSGGDRNLDFELFNPFNQVLETVHRKSDGFISYNSTLTGSYQFCFFNQITTKSLNFYPTVIKKEVHTKTYSIEETELQVELEKLQTVVSKLEAELQVFLSRNQNHIKVSDFTDAKVKWWSIVQAIVILAICTYQIRYLKSIFEVKRLV